MADRGRSSESVQTIPLDTIHRLLMSMRIAFRSALLFFQKQHSNYSPSYIAVFVSDMLTENAIRDVLARTRVSDRIVVVEGRDFLLDLIGKG